MSDRSVRAKKDVSLLIDRLNMARDLIELGARPVIAALMADIDPGYALGLYVDIHGARPPRGMLPSSPDWYFKSQNRVVDSSAFMMIYRRVLGVSGDNTAQSLVIAYRLFLKMTQDNSLDIGRAWTLTRLVKSGMLKERKCFRCQSLVITPPNVVFNSSDCPVCKSVGIKS